MRLERSLPLLGLLLSAGESPNFRQLGWSSSGQCELLDFGFILYPCAFLKAFRAPG